jgi:hypothetical protein
MRSIIAGFFTATLYTLAVATLIANSMPSQDELQSSIEAMVLATASRQLTEMVEEQPDPTVAVE